MHPTNLVLLKDRKAHKVNKLFENWVSKVDIVTTGNIPPTMHMAKEKDGAIEYRQK